MRDKVLSLVESKFFQYAIVVLIIINAITLGLETDQTIVAYFGETITLIDNIILYVFIIEIGLRIFAHRLAFFKNWWYLFDLTVVCIALFPATETFSALRTLRVMRVLRLVSAIPAMRRVIEGLLTAVPGIISVASIMALFFYVFSVIGTHLYGQTFPQWFGSIGETMFSLFQIMTLESWSMGIVRPVMEVHPSAWAFFVMYILVTTFTMLNLFIAIIVTAMQGGTEESAEESRTEMKQEIKAQLDNLEVRLLEEIRKQKQ